MFSLPILSHRRFDFRPYPSYLSQDATTRSLEKPLKHHAGAAPAPPVWKTGILAVIRMVHGGKRYFTFYTAPLPVPAVILSPYLYTHWLIGLTSLEYQAKLYSRLVLYPVNSGDYHSSKLPE